MKQAKRKKLEAKGWKVGTAAEFLGLSPEEEVLIDMKLALARHMKALRTRKKLSQKDVAKLLESSQSRVAKMEAGEPSVSMDLLVKALLVMGASQKDLAKTIATKSIAA